jgi:hypothetical protein
LIGTRTAKRTETREGPGPPRSNGHPRRPVNGTEFAPKDLPRPAGGRNRFQRRARMPRLSEPILIPKLRIQFADFPYLHYSIDQRRLTLETCCGYGYEPVRGRRSLPRIFKVPPTARGCHENCGTLRQKTKTHSPCERIPGPRRLMQKRQLFPELRGASPSRVALPRQTRGPNGSATGFRNMDRIPFRLRVVLAFQFLSDRHRPTFD